jgi:hypothetical protein
MYIRFQKSEADLTQSGIDIRLAQPAASAEARQGAPQALREILKQWLCRQTRNRRSGCSERSRRPAVFPASSWPAL